MLKDTDENGGKQCDAETAELPGTVLSAKDTLLIKTGDGCLAVTELQLEGKKRMDAAAFLRGYQVKPGEILGNAV